MTGMTVGTANGSTYANLIELLDSRAARYRLIDHEPEGVTAVASRLRGHALGQAAKCIVVRVKLGKKVNRFVLAVVPGDRRVHLERVRELLGGSYVSFATTETAEQLSGCVSGSIIPFSFRDELELIVDPDLLSHQEIYFNAARLDRSIALDTDDYVELSRPRVEPIAQPAMAA